MKQNVLIFAVVILVIGASLFHDQVLAIFAGMTVMDSLKFIVQFILHVTVATIAAYVMYTLPEVVNPWLRALRKGRRARKDYRGAKVAEVQRSKGTTIDQLLRAYVMAQAMKTPRGNAPTASQNDDDVRLNF